MGTSSSIVGYDLDIIKPYNAQYHIMSCKSNKRQHAMTSSNLAAHVFEHMEPTTGEY